jgi:ubiquinone/menaquinone biosynthesis C-methylase UbiE
MTGLHQALERINDALARGVPRSAVLDVGCGVGDSTRRLADALSAATEIVGIDPDKDSVDEARQRTDDRRVRYLLRAADQLPHPDGHFGVVSISNALHHLADSGLVLSEMLRVLRPGGWFVLVEVVSDGLTPAQENAKAVHHLKAAIDRSRGHTHRDTYVRSQVRAVVSALGLEAVEESLLNEDAEAANPADQAISFLKEYVEHADGTQRAELVSLSRDLLPRLVGTGVARPPRIVLVGRKPPSA